MCDCCVYSRSYHRSDDYFKRFGSPDFDVILPNPLVSAPSAAQEPCIIPCLPFVTLDHYTNIQLNIVRNAGRITSGTGIPV